MNFSCGLSRGNSGARSVRAAPGTNAKRCLFHQVTPEGCGQTDPSYCFLSKSLSLARTVLVGASAFKFGPVLTSSHSFSFFLSFYLSLSLSYVTYTERRPERSRRGWPPSFRCVRIKGLQRFAEGISLSSVRSRCTLVVRAEEHLSIFSLLLAFSFFFLFIYIGPARSFCSGFPLAGVVSKKRKTRKARRRVPVFTWVVTK